MTFPTLNDYIAAMNKNRYSGNAMKKKYTNIACLCANREKSRFDKPVILHFHWVEKDRRRDKDNISSAGRKFCMDGFVKSGLLENDSWKYVDGFTDKFSVDKKEPRIEIIIEAV